MPAKECCRTCQHCFPGQGSADGWCRLRKIRLNSEISAFAFCHHWSKRLPTLPILKDQSFNQLTDKQLDFGKVLIKD